MKPLLGYEPHGSPRGRLDAFSYLSGLLSALGALFVLNCFRWGGLDAVSALSNYRIAMQPQRANFLGHALDQSKLAFILETRYEPPLLPLLLHMIMTVPAEWPFLLIGSEANIAGLRKKDNVRALEEIGKLRFEEVDARWPITDQGSLSAAFTNESFWAHYVGPSTEHVLIWQSDSIMCANSEQTLNDWLQYDWVGAPWMQSSPWPTEYGGNGGFSLRRMSALRKLFRNHPYTVEGDLYEDLYFLIQMANARNVNQSSFNPAPVGIEGQFSVESVYSPKPMAFHIGWDGRRIHDLIWQHWPEITEWCPEVKLIMPTARPPPRQGEVCA